MNEPDFENMSKEEIDQMLIAYGYDPEMVARTGRFVAQVGIENIKLKTERDKLRKALELQQRIAHQTYISTFTKMTLGQFIIALDDVLGAMRQAEEAAKQALGTQ